MRRAVRGTGKTLIALGVLILLFVGYQLWGTGLAHDRNQRNLRSQFAKDLEAGNWYANVHTAANPGGEIRGQMMRAGGPRSAMMHSGAMPMKHTN